MGNRNLKHECNFNYVKRNTAYLWARTFFSELMQIKMEKKVKASKLEFSKVCSAYSQAKKRLFLLDYDGTLTPIVKNPQDAKPSPHILMALEELIADKRNQVGNRSHQSLNSNWMLLLPGVHHKWQEQGVFRPVHGGASCWTFLRAWPLFPALQVQQVGRFAFWNGACLERHCLAHPRGLHRGRISPPPPPRVQHTPWNNIFPFGSALLGQ